MKRTLFAIALGFLSTTTFADTLQGTCVGYTDSGKTLTVQFCVESQNPRELIRCSIAQEHPTMKLAKYLVNGTIETLEKRVYNSSVESFDDSMSIEAALKRDGSQRVSIVTAAEAPANMTIDLSYGWRGYEFSNAECSFEHIED